MANPIASIENQLKKHILPAIRRSFRCRHIFDGFTLRRRTALLSCVVLIIFAGGSLAFLSFDGRPGVRMRADHTLVSPASTAAPLSRAQTAESAASAPRQRLTQTPHPGDTAEYPHSKLPQGLIRFASGNVFVETQDGPFPLTRLRESTVTGHEGGLERALTQDFFTPAVSGPSLLYGEKTDLQGKPSRWAAESGQENQFLGCRQNTTAKAMARILARRLGIPLGENSRPLHAGRYRDAVETYATKYNLSVELIFAIMRTESNFNPFAVSPSNALGLMQIIPDTAGASAHAYLTGVKESPSAETLFNPELNIKYGVAYLHILDKRVFNTIINPVSREMCVIAAYNGGPGTVLRAFDTDSDAAVAAINALTPEELFDALSTRLPTAESRRYVGVVLGHLRSYSAL